MDRIGLLINGWFLDKCQTMILIPASQRVAYANDTKSSAIEMFKLLVQLESINIAGNDPKKAVTDQEAAVDETLKKVAASGS
jgi:hypothetical protein